MNNFKRRKIKKKHIIYFILSIFFTSSAFSADEEMIQILKGKDIYNRTCQACHQKEGAGMAGLAPSINNADFFDRMSKDDIYKTIDQGRPQTAMVSFRRLGEENIHALVAFINSWNTYHDRTEK